jgi:putative membrane protein
MTIGEIFCEQMIITRRIWISRVLTGSWKILLFLVLICVVAFFFNEFILKHYIEYPSIIPAILGPALAFFIGFNNNQAYDRWWEARKIWGTIVNDSRTWARQLICYSSVGHDETEEKLIDIRKRAIYRHIAFLYALKENLRGENEKVYRKYLTIKESEEVEQESNIHNAILTNQSNDLELMYKNGWIDGFKFLELNKMIIRFCDEMGKSERIKNTVFPTTYIYYTRVFIWFLVVSIIFVFTDLVGPWSILFGVFLGYIFLVIHGIGLAILNPFEPTPSGISLDQITRIIEINLLEALGESEIPEPINAVNNEYIM